MESSVRLFSVASGVLAVCVCFNWLTCLLIPSPGIFNRLVGYPVIPQVVPEAFMTTKSNWHREGPGREAWEIFLDNRLVCSILNIDLFREMNCNAWYLVDNRSLPHEGGTFKKFPFVKLGLFRIILKLKVEIIRSRGYPLEIHEVRTKDGYILELHRIPNGHDLVREESLEKKKAVFLQHGLWSTDNVWLINSSNRSLAYILADHNYDVWLGNSRGNTYSRKHASLDSSNDAQYWNYSWEEMAHIDLLASIDYILNVTAQEKLTYVGHSLGSTLFFMAMAAQTEYNAKIELMIGMGPSSNMHHMKNTLVQVLAPLDYLIEDILSFVGIRALATSDSLPMRALRFMCETSFIGQEICKSILFDIFGHSENFNMDMLHVSNRHYPSGGSVRQFTQFLQNYKSGEKFTRFDYGHVDLNMKNYGTSEPPDYNMSLVTAPVYLIYGDNDPLVPPEDVAWLSGQLGNLKKSIRVNDPSFTHGDFIWSPKSRELVHDVVLEIMDCNETKRHNVQFYNVSTMYCGIQETKINQC